MHKNTSVEVGLVDGRRNKEHTIGMKLVGDFLARFHNLTPPNDSLRRAVAEALSDTLRMHIPSEKIMIQNGIAHIQVSSVAKSAIRVHRGEILRAVFENLPKARTSLRDIR